MTIKQAVQIERWKRLFDERNKSDMTLKAFCSANRISKDAYYYWKNKIEEEPFVDTATSAQPVPSASFSFVEFTPAASASEAGHIQTGQPMAVIQQGNTRIELLPNASAAFIRQLLEGVRHA